MKVIFDSDETLAVFVESNSSRVPGHVCGITETEKQRSAIYWRKHISFSASYELSCGEADQGTQPEAGLSKRIRICRANCIGASQVRECISRGCSISARAYWVYSIKCQHDTNCGFWLTGHIHSSVGSRYPGVYVIHLPLIHKGIKVDN